MGEQLMRWETVKDGYHKELRVVDTDGRICGGVRGDVYDKNGWHAWTELSVPSGNLGRYVTLGAATRAVETALAAHKEKAQ